MKIARRQAISVLRTMPIPAGSDAAALHSNGKFDPDNSEWIESEHLLGLLVRLSAEERRLVCLHFFDNHSPSEIASAVGRPVAMVSRQLSLAVARLKYWWESEQELS